MRYVRDALGRAAAAEVVERSAIDLTFEQVHEPDRWFSAAEVRALAVASAEVCGDPEVGRRAGERLLLDSFAAGASDFIIARGSVEAAMKTIVALGTKMSTGAKFRVVSSRVGEVIVEGSRRAVGPDHGFFCSFTSGYYSMVPSLFGGFGRVAEPVCQARGDATCRYHLTWSDDPRPGHGRAAPDQSAARAERMLARFEQLQTMASDLVRADDVDAVLEAITERAGLAVQAPKYLLATRAEDSETLQVHHFGFRGADDAHHWARRLLDGELGEHDGILVAPVESPRRHYGLLAAVYDEGAKFSEVDRRFINAYAGHAAAALEVVSSLAGARRDRDSARALLELARELAVVGTSEEITRRLAAAIGGVTACDRASVWLWDDARDEIVLSGDHDRDGAPPNVPGSIRLSPADLPGLADLVARPRAILLQAEAAVAPLRSLFDAAGITSVTLVPIVSHGAFRGVVSGGFRRRLEEGGVTSDLLDRLDGVAHYAATALENAELLEQARYQALHDALTGLPNRSLVEDRAQHALARARRHGGHVGLLFIDLDRFKNVNDSLGHSAGDELISAVATRLARVVRDEDTLGRLGGDEFTVLLPLTSGTDDAARVAERLIHALAAPFVVNGQELFISCSIGIACAPEHGMDYTALMRNADSAMYDAKALGRSTYAVHSATPTFDRRHRLGLESDLHRAIDNEELRVFYQAQVDLGTLAPVGVEALVRWQHPELGLLPPGAFLPLAEESGLIVGIDRWVRRTAFAQGRAWSDAGTPVRIAVNLSTRELASSQLVPQIASELAESGLCPSLVEIEVTDRVVMDDAELPSILDGLRALGVRLAIDDFGTGNSVLGRLQRCHVDTLKIDRSFIQDIADGVDAPVVAALISLAQSLGLSVVAEGVETELQASALRSQECAIAQGFLYSRPVPVDEMTALLGSSTARPSRT